MGKWKKDLKPYINPKYLEGKLERFRMSKGYEFSTATSVTGGIKWCGRYPSHMYFAKIKK
jgi:hypothetical protein